MDKLQVVALCLELTGFMLAFCHIYFKGFTEKVDSKLLSFFEYLGFNGIIYYDSLGYRGDEYVFSHRLLIFAIRILFWFLYIVVFGFSSILVLNIFLFIFYLVAAEISTYITHAAFALFSESLVRITKNSGRGDFVVGLGFFFAFSGMIIESVQVSFSEYWWSLIPIWLFAALFFYRFYFK